MSTHKDMAQSPADKPFHLNENHEKFLLALLRYRVLTNEQLTTRYMRPSMRTTMRAYMYKLAQEKYVIQGNLSAKTLGQKPKLNYLAGNGIAYFKTLGADVPKRYRPIEELELSYSPLMHTLNLNDIIIAAELLPRQEPSIEINYWLHEQTFRRKGLIMDVPASLLNEHGEIVIDIEPDALIDFRWNRPGKNPYQYLQWIEVDRNWEGQEQVKNKMRKILAFMASGQLEKLLGTQFVTVTWIVTRGGQDRVKTLRQWQRDVLEPSHKDFQWSFLFTSLPPHPVYSGMLAPIDPFTLFRTTICYYPYTQQGMAPMIPIPHT